MRTTENLKERMASSKLHIKKMTLLPRRITVAEQGWIQDQLTGHHNDTSER